MARLLLWWASWWIVLFWLALAFQGEWNVVTWGAAAIGAAGGATIAALVRAQHELRLAPRAHWLREAVDVPWQSLVDTVVVLGALRRGRPHGLFHARPTGPRGESAEDGTRGAFLVVAASISPNAYVVDVDRGTGDVLLHELVPRRESERPA